MERLRSSDRVRSIINSKSTEHQKYKFTITQNQIDSEIVPRPTHRASDDTLPSDSQLYKKRVTRATPRVSTTSRKLTTTFNDAILESV